MGGGLLDARGGPGGSLGPDLAAGISAGAVEKRRPPVDANEDVCAIATSGHASLLAVADAHSGREAAEIAIEHVIAALAAETGQSGLPAMMRSRSSTMRVSPFSVA